MFYRDRVLKLLEEKGWTKYRLAKEANIPQSSLHDILSGRIKNPTAERLKAIAKALDVTVDEFLNEDNTKESKINTSASSTNDTDIKSSQPKLSKKDERDIQKDLNKTLEQLESSQDGLMFDGEPLDDETRELLKISLENSMRIAKQAAKKFTPKKYRK